MKLKFAIDQINIFLITLVSLTVITTLQAEINIKYDLDESAELIRTLNEQAANGNYYAKHKLRMLKIKGVGRAVDYVNTFELEKRIKNNPNDSVALCKLGESYIYQMGGQTQNIDKGLELLNQSANLDNNDAMWQLGILHWRKLGLGISQDVNEAEKWYKKLYERNDARGAEELGWIGYYVDTKDINETIAYFEKASQMGRHNGYCQIGKIYAEGRRIQADQEKAVKYFALAADMNSAEAAFREAEYHIYNPIGENFKPDPNRAVKLLGFAFRQGGKDMRKKVYNMVYFDSKQSLEDFPTDLKKPREVISDPSNQFVKRMRAINASDKNLSDLIDSFENINKDF